MFERLAALFRRPAAPIATRAFDAAAGGRRWQGAGATPSLQSAILSGREPVRRRAQDAVLNNGLAASALSVTIAEAIESGLSISPQTGDPGLDKEIDERFSEWASRSDYFGLTDFYGWQAMACGRAFVDGEIFTLLAMDDSGELRLKSLDVGQLNGVLNQELPGGGLIVSGVEFSPGGRRVAYHVYSRWMPSLPLLTGLEIERIDAGDMIHVFEPQTAAQVRGVSKLAPVLLRLREYDSLIDAQLVRQKIGALLCGFVVDADGSVLADSTSPGEPSLEPGTLQRLRPGENISFSDPPATDAGADAFQKNIIREIASGLGIPPFLLDGDMGSVNFSSARVGLIAFRRRLEQWQGLFTHMALRPIYRRWLTLEILSGRIDVELNERTLNHRWIPPKSVWVDPLKDVQAEVLAINSGLLSRRESVGARGYSIEELDQEIASDKAREKALGISFATPAQQPQGAPQDENA
jgi:lambda family phage portal protein